MPTVVATTIVEIPKGYNEENLICFQAVAPVADAADTLTIQLPANWVGKGFTVKGVRLEQFVTAAAGARTKLTIPVTSWSYVETTGLVYILIGATAITTNGRVYIDLAPASLFTQVKRKEH